jgi:hypothetical protein
VTINVADIILTTSSINPQHFLGGLLISFTKFITKEGLYTVTLIFLAITALLVTATYAWLYASKKTFFYKQRIQKQLEIWISKAILEELDDEHGNVVVSSKFKRLIKNPIARQFVMDELLATKKSLTGAASANIVKLYLELGLKESSIKKMEHKKWHIKASGIQELYVMEQQDMLVKIYRQTNSKNEFVRMEAQTAIIHLSGFKGLRFLDIVNYPITDWQQLKLLDQLSQVSFEEMKNLGKWLQSENSSVVLFALRIAETYQQFQVHDEAEKCLKHTDETIRMQAVRTLASIGNDATAAILAAVFEQEKFTGKLNILECIVPIATANQMGFLMQLLGHPNELIRLKAARALASCSPLGLAALETRAVLEPEPYQRIFLHVQSEMKT